MPKYVKIKRALFSCWDKTGLSEFARSLAKENVEMISSGGTAAYLQKNDIKVNKVEDITASKEILDGRVKTLHPAIHGAILAKRTPEHLKQLKEMGIEPIDLVVVNLYPFTRHLKDGDRSLAEMIEFIDIGGPAMVRAAAKNWENVIVLHSPGQYETFLKIWKENNFLIPTEFRLHLASEAFFRTAFYDSRIAWYLDFQQEKPGLPDKFVQFYSKKNDLRYGENPHQNAALYQNYADSERDEKSVLIQHWGKEMSYNNYVDVAAAAEMVKEFPDPTVVVVKHTNPCGAASSEHLSTALDKALASDPVSAFGGIIAANRPMDGTTAQIIQKGFYECVISPDYSQEALKILKKKKNLRILQSDFTIFNGEKLDLNRIPFGLLIQEKDRTEYVPDKLHPVDSREPTAREKEDLMFAWKVVKNVKSNAIVMVKDRQVLGVGAGQMSRVDAVRIAVEKARQQSHNLTGAVMASDAFFPFRDGIDEAFQAGIAAVIQPGGSIRDEEVIRAVKDHRMAMLLTHMRHFKH